MRNVTQRAKVLMVLVLALAARRIGSWARWSCVLVGLIHLTDTAPIFGELSPGARVPPGVRAAHTTPAPAEESTISVTIPTGAYRITSTERGDELSVVDLGSLLVPGKPILPSKVFAIAIPPGAELVGVSFDTGPAIVLPRAYRVPPAPLPRVIGEEDPVVYAQDKQTYEKNFNSVYRSDEAYPQDVGEFIRTAGYRRYNLVDVRITPLTYRPLSGQLTYHPQVTAHVTYTLSQEPADVPVDTTLQTERLARDLVVNYDQAKYWPPDPALSYAGAHDFVIITLDSLVSAVAPLVSWETSKGRTVSVVTTSWISSTYDGYDLAEQIRNFLRDKYPSSEWGIEDALLVGHYDDLPMRRAGLDVGHGIAATDFYYAELSLPDDQSWDQDGDHRYAEESDPIDFYSEVNVGRIPWSEPGIVLSICERSVAYEQNDSPAFKKHMLLLGAFFWADTDTAALMEAKVDQSWMDDWTVTRLYEKNATAWSSYECDLPLTHSNVMSTWSMGKYAFVNWAGHGLPWAAHTLGLGFTPFIRSSDSPLLNEYFPAVVFADACSNGDPNHDNNIGRAMLGNAAVGFVGATHPAYGCNQWDSAYDGCSQSLDYFFTTAVTSGEYTQGEALQWALREMYTSGLWYDVRYEMFEWAALLGNPNLRVAQLPPLKIALPDGAPEHLQPDTGATFSVRIVNGSEEYVTGTGLLHYRYDGGAFLTSALLHHAGDVFTATLPTVGCSATPEFYLSAEGDGGSTVLDPLDAPDVTYRAAVGTFRTIMRDDFDSDPGWSTEGEWAFGQPAGGGGEYGAPDPTGGYSGDNVYGYNLYGDYPNSLPEKHLTSTAIDCTGLYNVHVKFWRWLGVEGKAYDRAYVRVSTDGDEWTTVWENDGLTTDYAWTEIDLDISAVADNQPAVYLRWTMGNTDGAWACCGWNIDDVELRVFECIGGPTCYDGMLNQGEDRIDCGGPCSACDCMSDGECDDGVFCNGVETCDTFGTCVHTVMTDCNGNDTEDSCDLNVGTSEDCDANGIPDECDIAACVGDPACIDCQPNNVPDWCDIEYGPSTDVNASNIPDECEPVLPPGLPSDHVHQARKNRYLSIDTRLNSVMPVAYELTLSSMKRCSGDLRRACIADGDCPGVCDGNHYLQCPSDAICGADGPCVVTAPCVEHEDVGNVTRYVDTPFQSTCLPLGDCTTQWFANLTDTPVCRVWTETTLHITDCEIAPAAEYEVRATTYGIVFSDPLAIGTIPKPQVHYGDCVGPVEGQAFTPPDGFTNVTDVQAYLIANQGGASAPHTTWVDLHGVATGSGCTGSHCIIPQQILNVGDLQTIKAGFIGKTYVDTPGQVDPSDCPP